MWVQLTSNTYLSCSWSNGYIVNADDISSLNIKDAEGGNVGISYIKDGQVISSVKVPDSQNGTIRTYDVPQGTYDYVVVGNHAAIGSVMFTLR